MKHLAAIQSQLAINKQVIKILQEDITVARDRKTMCDYEGYLDAEHYWHKTLKNLRSQLKNYVRLQQALKQLCKGNV
jgi:alpha/beta superfamily hydrolase